MMTKNVAHAEREHSNVISPSSVSRNFACEASFLDPINPIKEVVSGASDKGTQAHELWEKLAKGIAKVGDIPDDDTIFDNAKTFLNHTELVTKKVGKKRIVHELIEGRVKYSKHTYGTVDHALLYVKDKKNKLFISDLKCGMHKVGAVGNQQLLTYALCINKTYNWAPDEVILSIVQPTYGEKPKVWRITDKELKAYETKLKRLEKKAVKIKAGDFKKKPKEVLGDHCFFCKRKHECDAYIKETKIPALMVLDDIEPLAPAVRENGLPDIRDWSNEQIAKAIYAFEFIRPLEKELTQLARQRIEEGQEVPGWKLVAGRQSRKWMPDPEYVAKELVSAGVSDPYQKKLRGITDIEREIGKGKLEGLTLLNTPEPKIVQESDKRSAITNTIVTIVDDIKEKK